MKKILFITFLFNYFLGIGQSPNSASIKGKSIIVRAVKSDPYSILTKVLSYTNQRGTQNIISK